MRLPSSATTALATAVLDEVELAVVGKRDALTLILRCVTEQTWIEPPVGGTPSLCAEAFGADEGGGRRAMS